MLREMEDEDDDDDDVVFYVPFNIKMMDEDDNERLCAVKHHTVMN